MATKYHWKHQQNYKLFRMGQTLIRTLSGFYELKIYNSALVSLRNLSTTMPLLGRFLWASFSECVTYASSKWTKILALVWRHPSSYLPVSRNQVIGVNSSNRVPSWYKCKIGEYGIPCTVPSYCGLKLISVFPNDPVRSSGKIRECFSFVPFILIHPVLEVSILST